MKTIAIPANASRDRRDILIARILRHIARVQRKVARMQANEAGQDAGQKEPAC